MLFTQPPELDSTRAAIRAAYLADEADTVRTLLPIATCTAEEKQRIDSLARELVTTVRATRTAMGGIDAFMHEYDLSSQEGVMLMCLAEALLRIPDADTADRLIRDKLAKGEWESHLGRSDSLFVNASTWGLMLTGQFIELAPEAVNDMGSFLQNLVARTGEPVLRVAMNQAMRILSHQFVLGRSIAEAIVEGRADAQKGYRHSFDLLGESAHTAADAERYFHAYLDAIDLLAREVDPARDLFDAPGLSVKLSALHPRFEFAQRDRVMGELVPRIETLVARCRDAGISVTLDTEEADRLDITLDIFAAVFRSAAARDYDGFGIAVQSYQKRALYVIDWLTILARAQQRRIPVRLVKGAYWDSEVKAAQQQGLDGYPVFTRKPHTDVSYLACMRRIFTTPELFYPQFASHNAHTLAAIIECAGDNRDFEFQRLYGMGDVLFDELIEQRDFGIPCRVYAPVGSHEDLLPYLVRRLLENGANTSFVNRIVDEQAPIEAIIADPVDVVRATKIQAHSRIPVPAALLGNERKNSHGVNLHDVAELLPLAQTMEQALSQSWRAAPLVDGELLPGAERLVTDPADRRREIGSVAAADADAVRAAIGLAHKNLADWSHTPVIERADCLERAADLFEQHRAELTALCVREGGRCVPDALDEVREAVDYCRYYAALACRDFDGAQELPGPAGERNSLALHGRGVFFCISPWNFPLALFAGQVIAALAAGNTVLAKPAGATPLVATLTTRLLHEAGIPTAALHCLPGSGSSIGEVVLSDPRLAGVAFTGSTETAGLINRTLAQRDGPILPLIAETGGQNAMIVDSSALPEQVVIDVIRSACNSAGQRCSALRVLFVQDDIAERVIELLKGAMEELAIGDPALLATDIGPVIDDAASGVLQRHVERMESEGKLVHRLPLPAETAHGSFFAPQVFEIERLDLLEREVFGPILHVIRYEADKLDDVIGAINATGYGLTLGVHSRVDATVRYIQQRVRVGNTYVNRNMIGAMVGVQPFGGEGLSGTGPKAGGPHYLHRFATERSVTVNTAAVGGNASLLSLDENE